MKMIQYDIKATLLFAVDENVDIEEYLEELRGRGEAEIVNVEIVEKEE